MKKLKVLFLCTGNSCRSQMAEGFSKHFKNDLIEAYSAGIETHGLNSSAVKVMAELGIDISRHKSKKVKELIHIPFDYVVTVCGHANETCPFFPSKAKIIHKGFNDPPKLAEKYEKEEEKFNCYRKVRDEIMEYIKKFPDILV
jgi:arsenate reductase (thioredoxin)